MLLYKTVPMTLPTLGVVDWTSKGSKKERWELVTWSITAPFCCTPLFSRTIAEEYILASHLLPPTHPPLQWRKPWHANSCSHWLQQHHHHQQRSEREVGMLGMWTCGWLRLKWCWITTFTRFPDTSHKGYDGLLEIKQLHQDYSSYSRRGVSFVHNHNGAKLAYQRAI